MESVYIYVYIIVRLIRKEELYGNHRGKKKLCGDKFIKWARYRKKKIFTTNQFYNIYTYFYLYIQLRKQTVKWNDFLHFKWIPNKFKRKYHISNYLRVRRENHNEKKKNVL